MSSSASVVKNETSQVMQNVPVAIPLKQLRRSKKNMRTISPKNSPEDKELLASIRAKGILQNLVVYPVDDHYEVPAGGRRFGALEYLLKKGEITDEFPVYCLLISEDEAVDSSLVENYHRKAPHPADVYIAFSQLIAQGRDVASIAKSYGIIELEVEKYLRLGNVHKTLFKLFKQDRITLDVMMAYASTPDTKLQIATFKAIGEDCDARAHNIREQLQNNRFSSDTALAKFVTTEAYQAAGGKIESDFFTDSVMLCDVEIVVKLAEEKLLAEAAKLKGWCWVETSMEGFYSLHRYNQLPRKKLPVPKSEAVLLKKLTDEYDKLEGLTDEQWNDGHEQRYDELEPEIDALREKIDLECTTIDDNDKPYGGCIVTFNQHSGSIEVHKGLMKPEDVKAYQSKDKPKSDASDTDNTEQKQTAQIKAKPALSARLVADLGTYRRSIIKAELAGSGAIAVDLLHFQVCLSALGKGEARWSRILDMSFSHVNDESSIGDYKKTEAAMSLGASYTKLDLGWLSLKGEAKQFAAFRDLSAGKRQALVAYCAAQQLLSGSTKPGQDKLIDAIVSELNIDFRKFWRPNSENYFSRLTRPLLLALGKKLRGAAWHNAHTNDSKKILVEGFQTLFHGSNESITEKEAQHKVDWIPAEIDK